MVVKTGYSRTPFPGGVSYGLQSRPLAIASQYLPLTPATPYPDGRGKGKEVLRYNSLQARPPTQIIIEKDLKVLPGLGVHRFKRMPVERVRIVRMSQKTH